VQDAALALVDRRGLAALSMRNLADALGTGPMTLYNYVRDRDALDALVVDAVMAEVALPAATQDWRQDVRMIAAATWRAVRRHPQVIPLLLTRRSLHAATLAPVEALLQALAASGRTGADLLVAFRTVSGFVAGLAQAQLPGKVASEVSSAIDPDIARVQALTPDRFPRLQEIAEAAKRMPPERELQAGLDIILAGLEAPSNLRPRSGRGRGPRTSAGG